MKSLINTLGGDTPLQNDILEQEKTEVVETKRLKKRFNKDSILDSINTGFGDTNTLVKDCSTPKFKLILYKEDYLSVFVSETEKELVRNNLGVVGVTEVTELVKKLVSKDIESFITTEKVEELINNLDFVNSTLKALADYIIPDKLFKL